MNDEISLAAIRKWERSARRRIPILLLGLGAIVAALVFAVISLNQAATTERQLRRAEERRSAQWKAQATDLERQIRSVRQAVRVRDLREADRLLRISLQDSQELKDLAAKPAAVPVTPPGGPANKTAPALAGPATSGAGAEPGESRPDVYIQFAGALQREQIKTLNRALKEAGWRVQGSSGERTQNARDLNEVGFSAARDQAAAEALADALNQSGLPGRTVRARRVPIVGAGTLEVWISN